MQDRHVEFAQRRRFARCQDADEERGMNARHQNAARTVGQHSGESVDRLGLARPAVGVATSVTVALGQGAGDRFGQRQSRQHPVDRMHLRAVGR